MIKHIKSIFKIVNFFNFIRSYRRILFKVIFYEIFYSIKTKELVPKMKLQNNQYRTDTIPCVLFFTKISIFLKKNKIDSVVDVGSGYGRIVNFISKYNDIIAHGIEYDSELHKSSLKTKEKKVNLYCGDIFNFDLENFNSICFILNDNLKKNENKKKFFEKFSKTHPTRDKYFIAINFCQTEFPNNFEKILSSEGSSKKSLNIYKIKAI